MVLNMAKSKKTTPSVRSAPCREAHVSSFLTQDELRHVFKGLVWGRLWLAVGFCFWRPRKTHTKKGHPMRVWPGHPSPLGATWDGKGVNFALFSEHATKVELCLFDAVDAPTETHRIPLPEQTDGRVL
jgi:hypothetical protein